MADRPAEVDIAEAALAAVGALIRSYPTKQQKSDAAAAAMLTAYNIMRAIEGDKFVITWLESAVADAKATTPPLVFRRTQ